MILCVCDDGRVAGGAFISGIEEEEGIGFISISVQTSLYVVQFHGICELQFEGVVRIGWCGAALHGESSCTDRCLRAVVTRLGWGAGLCRFSRCSICPNDNNKNSQNRHHTCYGLRAFPFHFSFSLLLSRCMLVVGHFCHEFPRSMLWRAFLLPRFLISQFVFLLMNCRVLQSVNRVLESCLIAAVSTYYKQGFAI